MKFELLFSPKKIGNVEIKNRIVMPPMGVNMNSGTGEINERYIAYFETRAKGGVGLITSSACAIDTETCGLAEPGQICLTKDSIVDGIKKITSEVHKYGGKMSFQLLHPGRQGSEAFNRGQQPVAPSAIKENDYLEMPRELSNEEIKNLVKQYIQAARYAYEGGADGVEIHAAHGYLIHQFMSPRANKRSDEYGGSFENRMRFVTEILEGIKAIKPDNGFISARINGWDGTDGGFDVEDAIEIAKYLEEKGIDALSVSSGTYSRLDLTIDPAIASEGWRTERYLKRVKAAVKIPVIAANNIKRPETAERILQEGGSDFVCLGRGSLADPEFSNKAQNGRANQIRICISCNNCGDMVQEGKMVSCSVNPCLGKESTYAEDKIARDGQDRKVVIVGGGPGGMEAALLAAKRGFQVMLFEKSDQLGGALLLASYAPGKDKVTWLLESYRNRIDDAGIKVNLNTQIHSLSELEKLNPYRIIIATGAKPVKPPIPGIDKAHVIQSHDVLKNPQSFKSRKVVLVGSGMTGLETAEVMLENGNSIAVYEMLDEIAKGANVTNKVASMNFLGEKGVSFHTDHKLVEINDTEVVFENQKTGEIIACPADLVVLSMGVKPNYTVEGTESLNDDKIKYVGDCAEGRKIVDATGSAYEYVWSM